MELLFLEAKPIPSHAITALVGSDYRWHSARQCQGNEAASTPRLSLGEHDDVRLDLLVLYLGDSACGVPSVPYIS